MADSSRVQLYYVSESTWGTTPASALTAVRYTGETLGYNITNTTSGEVRSDRQVSDLIQTGAETRGDINFELSYGAHDVFLASAMFSDWGAALAINVTGDIAASNTNGELTSGLTDFASEGVNVGQWIKVAGFTDGGNNGYYKVTSVAANAIGVSPAPNSDEAAGGATIDISGSMLRNGVTRSSFTLEKNFSDIGKYISFTGMVPSKLDLSIRTGSTLTGSVGFMGKEGAIADATVGTGAPNDAPSNSVMNSVSNVGEIRENGVLLTGTAIKSMSVSLDNSLRGFQAVGSLGNVDIGAGQAKVSGNIEVYFSDGAIYEKYLAGTSTSLSFKVQDGAGNAYMVTMPKIKLNSGTVTAGGNDQDIMASYAFQAIMDPTTESTLQIDRFAA